MRSTDPASKRAIGQDNQERIRRSPLEIVREIASHVSDKPKSINRIAQETGMNWKTVDKYLNLIKTAKLIPMEIIETEDTTYVREPELTTLPIDIQAKYERERFYAKIEQEDIILVSLLRNPKGIILPKTTKLVEMLRNELIIEREGMYFLTETGVLRAKATLSKHPELVE
ncbi:MAG: hypothetical protein AYK19_09715 [Theionarchaea archaeon DG-70-1]|nr:MAG: hypothetical protein AYK19_09715 [Theionarchaea archaeon DG-70-1]